jgi:hypothetical protein
VERSAPLSFDDFNDRVEAASIGLRAAWYGLLMRAHRLRLRVGILLMALSWFPFAQIIIYIARNHGRLTSDSSASSFRLLVWGIQIVVGLVGVALVGKLAVEEAKRTGWRRTPRRLWELFRHGPEETDA